MISNIEMRKQWQAVNIYEHKKKIPKPKIEMHTHRSENFTLDILQGTISTRATQPN